MDARVCPPPFFAFNSGNMGEVDTLHCIYNGWKA